MIEIVIFLINWTSCCI